MTSRRLYIAIDLSVAVIEQLMERQEALEEALGESARVRWVHPEQVHLTLKYLDGVDSALLEPLHERLERFVAPLFPFQAECTGVRAWPEQGAARLLWARLDAKSSEVLALLQRALERDLDELGLPPDPRPFEPGLLLGRVAALPEGGREAIDRLGEARVGASTIKDIALCEALLGAHGPRHVVLQRYVLGGP